MWEALAAQFAGQLGSSMGKGMTSAPPPQPNVATSGTYGSTAFDGSGWTLNFGGAQYAAPTQTKLTEEGLPQAQMAVMPAGATPLSSTTMVALVVGGVVLLKLLKRK